MIRLSVHLVTYNNSKYIPYLFKFLRKQTFRDWEFLIIDNNSTDDTFAVVKKELENFSIRTKIIENKENKGFAGGHNQAFGETNSEYFLLLNPDIFIESDCFEKLVQFLDKHPEAAAVAPRLMRWNFPNGFTNTVDALGLRIFRNRRVIEQGSGEEWVGNTGEREVFGISGTVALLRRSAIQEIVYSDGNVFDESLHTYKEDIDLAYRLQSRGFKCFVVLDAVAYHNRGSGVGGEVNDWSAAANKKTQSAFVRYHSYKNHLATLYKNEYWQNFLLDFPWIMWYEVKKFGWLLLFDCTVLKGLSELWKNRQDLNIKRLKIKESRKVKWKEIRKWWS